MGNTLSSKSKAIDKQLKLEKKKAAKEIKILLLGTTTTTHLLFIY
jgi:guanine nucleotide-binding protein subunit alpha